MVRIGRGHASSSPAGLVVALALAIGVLSLIYRLASSVAAVAVAAVVAAAGVALSHFLRRGYR